MSGKGNCHENAAVETVFKTIKAEPIWRRTRESRRHRVRAFLRANGSHALTSIHNGFYNPRRGHSAPRGKSPLGFKRQVA